MYARTKRCYNERGSTTNSVRSSIRHCILYYSPSSSVGIQRGSIYAKLSTKLVHACLISSDKITVDRPGWGGGMKFAREILLPSIPSFFEIRWLASKTKIPNMKVWTYTQLRKQTLSKAISGIEVKWRGPTKKATQAHTWLLEKKNLPNNFCCRGVVSIVIHPTHSVFQSVCSRDVWRIEPQT